MDPSDPEQWISDLLDNRNTSQQQQFYANISSTNSNQADDPHTRLLEDQLQQQEQCSSSKLSEDLKEEKLQEEESSLVDIHLAKVADKLSKLIKSSESKRANIRSRLSNGELEPQFLALEHKVVTAEHIRSLEDLQADVQKLRGIVSEDKEKKDNEHKSQTEVFKQELFKEVVALLETEFSCVVCSEVFVQACVIECGHTFCSYCINQWKREKNECPICRKQIIAPTKHVEMDNFVTKIHTVLSEDIQNRRKDLVAERENTVRNADEEAARRPISPVFNEFLVQGTNGFYHNVRFVSREILQSIEAMEGRDYQNLVNYPVTPPPSDIIPEQRDIRPRQYRLMPTALRSSQLATSPPRHHGPAVLVSSSSDDESEVPEDYPVVVPSSPTGTSPSEYFFQVHGASLASYNLPVPLPLVFTSPSGAAAAATGNNNNSNNNGSMNHHMRNIPQPFPHNHSRFCPYAHSHGMNVQNSISAIQTPPTHHHHLYTALEWPSSLTHPSTTTTTTNRQQYVYPEPTSGDNRLNNNNRPLGYTGQFFHPQMGASPPAAHANNNTNNRFPSGPVGYASIPFYHPHIDQSPRPPAAHANNRFPNQMEQQQQQQHLHQRNFF